MSVNKNPYYYSGKVSNESCWRMISYSPQELNLEEIEVSHTLGEMGEVTREEGRGEYNSI